MRKIFTPLVFFCLLGTFLQGQCLKFTSSPVGLAVSGGQIDVKVTVSGFDSLLAIQSMFGWDESVLQIDSISYVSSSVRGLTASSFALPSQTNTMTLGRLRFLWNDPSVSGVIVNNGHHLFSMRFNVIGNECDSTAIELIETGMFFTEAINEQVVDVGAEILPNQLKVAGAGCGGFGSVLACNSLINVALDPSTGQFSITPDMILEGGPYNYDDMSVLPSSVDCDDLNQTVIVTVTENNTGNACWSEILVGDPSGQACDFNDNLACNANVFVSLSPFGSEATITPDMILEGGPYNYSNMTVSPSTLSCDDIGDPVVVTVTDITTGNSCWGEVTVEDKTAPVVIVESDLVVALSRATPSSPYSATVFVEDVDDGTYDNCGPITLTPSSFSFDCSDLGQQQIVVTATDFYGNFNQAFTTVSVILNNPGPIACPQDVLVDCTLDINDEQTIISQLGAAFVDGDCMISYSDSEGFDENNDGDLSDNYEFNGQTISESYFSACNYGTILREWTVPGNSSETCKQRIMIVNEAGTFDGNTMIDWPYSLNSFVALGNNDSSVDCNNACSPLTASDIDVLLDENNNPELSLITIECEEAFCEEPLWTNTACDLLAFSVEEVRSTDGDDLIIQKNYTVINWCEFDGITDDGKWEWRVVATIPGGAVNQLTLDINNYTAAQGENICVPITVDNFNNIESAQGSINWDPTMVAFESVKNFRLPGLSANLFGLSEVDAGKLSFLWIDATGVQPVSLNNGASIFDVCFDIVGNDGDVSPIEFTDEPTEIELTSNNQVLSYRLSNGSISIGESSCSNDIVNPTPYCISNVTATFTNGQLRLWAIDFDAGSFDNCTDDLRFTFSSVSPELDINFQGNSSYRDFNVSDYNNAREVQIGLPIYVWDEAGNSDFCTINLTLLNPDGDNTTGEIGLIFEDQATEQGASICVPLIVNNFTDIQTFQGSVNWNPSVLEYTGVQNLNLPALNAGSFNDGNIDGGQLSFVWFDNSGVNPASLNDGNSVFDVCFDVVGTPGSFSEVEMSSIPTTIQLSSPSPLGVRTYYDVPGLISVIDGNCAIEDSDIIWPTQELQVYIDGLDENNAGDLLAPDALLTLTGIEEGDVYPSFQVPQECEPALAYTYEDVVFNDNDRIRVVRNWTVLNWLSLQVFEYTQIIRSVSASNLICDTLPNSAPFGDCDSGHTDTDDVEWPDDLNVADHRISPDELAMNMLIDFDDTRPIFVNSESLYQTSYLDIVDELSLEFLKIRREWTVTRSDISGISWVYNQIINVDLSNFGMLVTVNTHNNRPVPEVTLSSNASTDMNGLAYTDESVAPAKNDVSYNGLNVRDIYLLQSYLQGDVELNEFQKLAADINNDGAINALDLIELRNVILEFDLQTSSDWRFNDSTNETSTGIEPKAHYIAIKPGDIDDSANIDGTVLSFEKSENLIIEDQLLNAGELYEIPLYLEKGGVALDLELHLDFDKNAIELLDVFENQGEESISTHIINEERVAMIYGNEELEPFTILSNEPILTLRFRAKSNGLLKDVFQISESRESFVLDFEGELIFIEGIYDGEITVGTNDLELDAALNVYPNPVTDLLSFELETALELNKMRFSILNDKGQLIQSFNQLRPINVSQYPSGVYLIQLQYEDRTSWQKFIKI